MSTPQRYHLQSFFSQTTQSKCLLSTNPNSEIPTANQKPLQELYLQRNLKLIVLGFGKKLMIFRCNSKAVVVLGLEKWERSRFGFVWNEGHYACETACGCLAIEKRGPARILGFGRRRSNYVSYLASNWVFERNCT